jgi:predicted aspartyl protease
MTRSASIAAMALGLSLLAGRVLAACMVSPLAELAVTTNDLRPMVPAKINGADALFIVDSGAFYSLISPSSATQYGLQLKPTTFGASMVGIGGETDLSFTTVKKFTLADAPIPDLNFLVGGAEPGGGAAGLLGRNVLGIGDVEYDLANGVIRLMRPKGCGGAVLAYWAGAKPYSVMEITAPNSASSLTTGTIFAGGGEIRATTGAAFVNGVRIRATFDTGAGTSVLSLRAAARAGVRPNDAGVVNAGLSRGIGRRTMETWIAPFASFKIGDEEIRNTRLRIGDLPLGDDVDMLIGADFFLSHRVYVANSQHKLYFTYNGGPVFNLEAAARVPAAADQAPKAAPPGVADEMKKYGLAP